MSGHADNPIDREFQLHIDIVADELIADGWNAADARREAQRRFGDRARFARQCRAVQRDYRGFGRFAPWVETVTSDLRYAIRSFRRAPGFALTAIITLALGIGATTTVFSVVDALMLRPLPYPESDRVVQVGTMYSGFNRLSSSSPANFFDWRTRSEVFEYLVASRIESRTIVTDGLPESVVGAGVSAGFFELLGATPLIGRGIIADDDRPGGSRAMVLRHREWQSRWGGDSTVVGRTVSLSGEPFTIVGVMPRDFHPPEAIYHNEVNFWIPLAHVTDDLDERDSGFLQVLGRLRAGVTPAVAAEGLTALQQRIFEALPPPEERLAEFRAELRVGVAPLLQQTVGDDTRLMWIFLGAVGLLLAIACANVANLFLARAADRSRELALRAALGAGGRRLVRQLLTESVALSLVAGAAGVLVALGGVRLFLALAPNDLPRLGEVAVDLRVLAFTAAVSITTGIVFGLAPAARYGRRSARDALQEGTANVTATRQRHRLRRALVATEAAVAMILLIAAGLLTNSFVRLLAEHPGFDPDGVAHMQLFIADNYETDEARVAFFDQLVERVNQLPGVTSAAATSDLPMTRNQSRSTVTAENAMETANTDVSFRRVTVGYFETLRIPMLLGRGFTTADRAGEPAAVVTESFARSFWGDADALGRRFKFGDARSDSEWLTIVGVAADIQQHALGDAPEPAVYLYHGRSPFVFGNLIARGPTAAALVPALRRELSALDPRQATSETGLLIDQMRSTVTLPRFNAMLFGVFGFVAMLIASVGVFGAVSYIVRQRTNEVGIRMALGASQQRVMQLVMRQGLGSVLIGIVVGVAATIPLSRALDALVFGIGTTDIPTYATVTSVLMGAAVLACWIPARRAVRVDPAATLRSE